MQSNACKRGSSRLMWKQSIAKVKLESCRNFFFPFIYFFLQHTAIYLPAKGSQTTSADHVLKMVLEGQQMAIAEMVHKCHSSAANSEASVASSCDQCRAEALLSRPLANKGGSVHLQLDCSQPYHSFRLSLFPSSIKFPIAAYPALKC